MVEMKHKTQKSGLGLVAEKLITKEDPLFVHKTLGVLVLTSYAWRFSHIWSDMESDLGFSTLAAWTLPTLFLHLCLNLSSFEFVIPKQRIKNGGRIWPEYRLHALAFTTRSVLAIAIRCYAQQYGLDDRYKFFLCFLTVMATMSAADAVSHSIVGAKHHSNSIRDAQAPPLVRAFWSWAQFQATAQALAATRCTSIFYNAFVVQLNPFGMTLVRKNLISHRTNVALYSLEIAFGLWLGFRDGCYYEGIEFYDGTGFCILSILANSAALWRMWPWWPRKWMSNKYLIWTAMYLLFEFVLRPIRIDPFPPATAEKRLILSPAKEFLHVFAINQARVMYLFLIYKQLQSGLSLPFANWPKSLSWP